MHPPLDRPHPDCQDVIQALRDCHETKPFWKIWACNEIKFSLDRCFKAEKKRRWADDQTQARSQFDAMDKAIHKMSFNEFLQKDKEYQKEMEEINAKKLKEQKQ
jgi:COX assembly protein 2